MMMMAFTKLSVCQITRESSKICEAISQTAFFGEKGLFVCNMFGTSCNDQDQPQ